jgi:hypothetical protein
VTEQNNRIVANLREIARKPKEDPDMVFREEDCAAALAVRTSTAIVDTNKAFATIANTIRAPAAIADSIRSFQTITSLVARQKPFLSLEEPELPVIDPSQWVEPAPATVSFDRPELHLVIQPEPVVVTPEVLELALERVIRKLLHGRGWPAIGKVAADGQSHVEVRLVSDTPGNDSSFASPDPSPEQAGGRTPRDYDPLAVIAVVRHVMGLSKRMTRAAVRAVRKDNPELEITRTLTDHIWDLTRGENMNGRISHRPLSLEQRARWEAAIPEIEKLGRVTLSEVDELLQ